MVCDAEGEPEAAQGVDLADGGSGKLRTDDERSLHAVFGRLVDDDTLGTRKVLSLVLGVPGPLLENVEVLTCRHLDAHPVELGTCCTTSCNTGKLLEPFVEELVAPAEQQIAEEQGGARAEIVWTAGPAFVAVQSLEPAMGGRRTAPGVRVVDDVVVDEGCGMEELERTGGRHHGSKRSGRLDDGRSGVGTR